MLPLVWAAAYPAEILRAYNGPYLRGEVQMEGLVRNVGSTGVPFPEFRHSEPPVLRTGGDWVYRCAWRS